MATSLRQEFVGLSPRDDGTLCPMEVLQNWSWAHGGSPLQEAWRLPAVSVAVIMILEILRTYPGEIRMYLRARKQAACNYALPLFVLLKYLGAFATVAHISLEWGTLRDPGCKAFYWIRVLFFYCCACLVSVTLALRTYIIFQKNRRVALALLLGILLQLASAITVAVMDVEASGADEGAGFCIRSTYLYEDKTARNGFLGISCLLDLGMIVASCWRLLKFCRGSQGLMKTSELLFRHNIHYLVTVFVLNVMQLVVYLTKLVPNLMFLVIAIQIAVGLQQLIAEQDAVHGYTGPPPSLSASGSSLNSRKPRATRPLALQNLSTSTRLARQSDMSTHDPGRLYTPADELTSPLPSMARAMKGYTSTYSGSDVLESRSQSIAGGQGGSSAGVTPMEEIVSPIQ